MGLGSDANIDLHHSREEHASGGRHRTRRFRDAHVAASRNKLQPVGSRTKPCSPLLCSPRFRRNVHSSSPFAQESRSLDRHRQEHAGHVLIVHDNMPVSDESRYRHQVRSAAPLAASPRAPRHVAVHVHGPLVIRRARIHAQLFNRSSFLHGSFSRERRMPVASPG